MYGDVFLCNKDEVEEKDLLEIVVKDGALAAGFIPKRADLPETAGGA